MKRKISILITITLLVAIASLAGCGKKPLETFFLASENSQVNIFTLKENKLTSAKTLIRGLEVIKSGETYTEKKVEYIPFKLEDSKEAPVFYVAKDNTAKKYEECMKETSAFVRTSTTLYTNAEDPAIAGFLRKGTALELKGFNYFNYDGTVNMYLVANDENEGYVYSKYLAKTEEEATSVNTEYFELNKDAVYSYDLLGGDPKKLDYFPFDKTVNSSLWKKEKEFPLDARTYYLNAACLLKNADGSYVVDNYIDLAKNCGCNAFVIDIEDGYLAYESEVAKAISPTSYNSALMSMVDYKESVDRIKDAGLWVIGRIVCFKDPQFASDYPEECIVDNGENTGWPSVYSRRTWEYKIRLAQEAVLTFDLDEIQFDYVRFPENAFALSNHGADFKNAFGEDKAEAVQNFCMYATDNIHKVGAYLSVDVFGESANGYVTAYGQYWPSISNVVDAISGMPYIDHFGRSVDTWSDQYTTVYNWSVLANNSQLKTPTPAVPRTWLTCYDVPYWSPYIKADANLLGNQIKGLWAAGIGYGGFLTWNGQSNLEIYYNVAPAFSATY